MWCDLSEIPRTLLKSDDYSITLADFLNGKGYSRSFIEHFIIPMGEAVWSADPVEIQ